MFQGALASRLHQAKLVDLHNMVGANELASAINLSSQEAPNDLGDDVNNCGSTKTEISYSLDQDADCIENELEEFYSYIEAPLFIENKFMWQEWAKSKWKSMNIPDVVSVACMYQSFN